IKKTTIDNLTTDSTIVTGTGEPGGTIQIKNLTTNKIIGTGKVNSNGKYSIEIEKQPAGNTVQAIVTYNGKKSKDSTVVTQGTITQTTIDNNLTTDSTKVTGTGQAGGTVIIKKDDGTELGRGTVDSTGHYSVNISKQNAGTKVKAEVNYKGKTSTSNVVTVSQGSLVQTTISNIDTNTTSVSGKGEPNAKIELKVGDQVIASGRVGSDGNYSLTISKQPVGTVVKAVVSVNGVTSEAHTTVTRADLAPTTISKVDTQTTVITGTGEPGGKIELLNGNQLIAHGYVGKDGHYSLTVMKQPAGSTIVAR
ncbi:hypothetical protein MYF49_002872, partial [Enterococcus faecium]|nr:hypothetical protein [Enterococcus faecium]